MSIIKKVYDYQAELILDTTGRRKKNLSIILDDESQCVIRILDDNCLNVYWRRSIPQDVAYGCMVIISEFMEDNQLDMKGSYYCEGKAKYIERPSQMRVPSKVPLYVMYDFVFVVFSQSKRKVLISVDTRDEMIDAGIEFHGIGTKFLPYKAKSGQETIIEGQDEGDATYFHVSLENKDDLRDCALLVNKRFVYLTLSFNRYDGIGRDNKDDNGVVIPKIINKDSETSFHVIERDWEKSDRASYDYSNLK